jgi:single-strand DNA-binding protein
MSINKVILEGRISKMGELKTSQAGVESIKFTVAVDRYTKDKESSADFIQCTAFRQTAKFVSSYFQKGKPIVVEGRMQTRDYADKDGNKRTATEVIVRDVYFSLSDGSRKGEGRQQEPYYAPAAFMPTDEDVPFE